MNQAMMKRAPMWHKFIILMDNSLDFQYHWAGAMASIYQLTGRSISTNAMFMSYGVFIGETCINTTDMIYFDKL